MGLARNVLLIFSGRMTDDVAGRWSMLIRALRARGTDVTVATLFAASASADVLCAADSSVHIVRVRNRADLGGAWAATRLKLAPDLIVTQGTEAQIVGGLVASRCEAPLVVRASRYRPKWIARMLTRFVAPHADGVIASDRRDLPRLVEQGYPPTRLSVISFNDDPLVSRGTSGGLEQMLDRYMATFDEAVAKAGAPATTATVERTPTRRQSSSRRITRHLNSALSRGVGYEFTPPGSSFESPSIRGYYIDFRAKTTSPTSQAPETLLAADLAQSALGWWERSLSGEAHAADEFRRVCVLLEERAERRNGQLLWPYDMTLRKYPYAWPPYSALAQAQAASVFVRAHLLSGDPRYADLAQRAIRSLVDEDSGLVSTTSAGPILEEGPGEPASHILNGWIYALWGLRDVQLALGSDDAGSVYEASLSCLRSMINQYDVGWWTKYSLYPHRLPDLAKPFYHRLHADQADILYRLTGFPEFGDAARRWRSYNSEINCARAIGQKVLFVARGYA